MPGRVMLWAVVVTLVLTALCLSVASADSVTAEKSRGKTYLTVAAGDDAVYGFRLSLQRGRFRLWDSPPGWEWRLLESWQLEWRTAGPPIVPGQSLSGFMVRFTGPGRNASWETLDAEGNTLAWGRVDLR